MMGGMVLGSAYRVGCQIAVLASNTLTRYMMTQGINDGDHVHWLPDASSISAFRENPERFRLRYRKHFVPKARAAAPDAGRAFHAAGRTWFEKPESDVEAALATLRGAWGEEP